MPRSKEISKDEIIKILQLKAQGQNPVQISRRIKRSLSSIYRVLRSGGTWNTRKRVGRPKKTMLRDDRMLLKMASVDNLSVRAIASTSRISKSTVHRRIKASKHIVYRRMKAKPCLKQRHKDARLKWARKHMSYGEKWLSVIFSDEKKWNLDGPDGYKFYWYDLRKEPKNCFSRQQGGGSVMTWGGFSFNGQTFLGFTDRKMKSVDYQDILRTNLLPIMDLLAGPDCVFQQDGASIHTSRSTKTWFMQNNITLLDWPALSPDLNPMENIWGILSRKIYENGKQYTCVNDLKTAIDKAWYEISPSVMQCLINSMEKRVFDVIKCRGNTITY